MDTISARVKSAAVLLVLVIGSWMALPVASAQGQRFFHSGDGRIRMTSEKNGQTFEGAYWQPEQGYDEGALRAIHSLFDAPYDPAAPNISLRLIAFLDFLEDRLRPGALITVTSGYRSPEYNKRIRKGGALAAKASLHQYGMAADIVMDGVSSAQVWQTVKALGFGGAGYYHGRTVHLDVGPARSWDEKTSGVGSGLSDDNKLIDLVTDFDVYHPGGAIVMHFTRMTVFPIGVAPTFLLEHRDGDHAGPPLPFAPTFAIAAADPCPTFHRIDQMASIRWELPPDLPPGRYVVRARFCGPNWNDMPSEVTTPVFEVTPP